MVWLGVFGLTCSMSLVQFVRLVLEPSLPRPLKPRLAGTATWNGCRLWVAWMVPDRGWGAVWTGKRDWGCASTFRLVTSFPIPTGVAFRTVAGMGTRDWRMDTGKRGGKGRGGCMPSIVSLTCMYKLLVNLVLPSATFRTASGCLRVQPRVGQSQATVTEQA